MLISLSLLFTASDASVSARSATLKVPCGILVEPPTSTSLPTRTPAPTAVDPGGQFDHILPGMGRNEVAANPCPSATPIPVLAQQSTSLGPDGVPVDANGQPFAAPVRTGAMSVQSAGTCPTIPNVNGVDKIVYAVSRSGTGASDFDIYSMNIDGTNQQQLTCSTYNNYQPAWSPDAKHIAFYSNRDGFEQIYVMDANGANQRRVTSDTNRNTQPRWSQPDGNQLIYVATDSAGKVTIKLINVDGSNPRTINISAISSRIGNNIRPDFMPTGDKVAF